MRSCPLARPLQAALDRRAAAAAQGPRRRAGADAVAALLAPALRRPRPRPALAKPACRRSPTRARALVAAAHRRGHRASSPCRARARSLLALAASGLNGQSFAFVGYLPIDGRGARPRASASSKRRRGATRQTQVLIETPYRNAALLAALLAQLQPTTLLSVSVGLTLARRLHAQRPASRAGAGGRAALPADVPAVFSLLAARAEPRVRTQDRRSRRPCRRTARRPSSSA